jgi:hypothetical protein
MSERNYQGYNVDNLRGSHRVRSFRGIMNCRTGDASGDLSRPARWTWFEIGSVVLYLAVLGASIAIALTDPGIGV